MVGNANPRTRRHPLSAGIYHWKCAQGLLALGSARKRVDGADVREFNLWSRFCPNYSQNEPHAVLAVTSLGDCGLRVSQGSDLENLTLRYLNLPEAE